MDTLGDFFCREGVKKRHGQIGTPAIDHGISEHGISIDSTVDQHQENFSKIQ